ncbi:MAG TPA: hypothetical protein HA286_06630 [Candidatus Poseidoniaceae archaeon]|nr:MAG TPA: hypothetical protein D7H96_06600 [Candidatus Poseidoniales archaeon]HIH53944.1 hypothetical protein [Candidatus Poseidoniaceae archaeon]
MAEWTHRQRMLAPDRAMRGASKLLELGAWPDWMVGQPAMMAPVVDRPEEGMILEIHRLLRGAPLVERWRVLEVRDGTSPVFAEVLLELEGQLRGERPAGRAFHGLQLRLTVLAEEGGGVEAAVKWAPKGLHRLLERRLRTDVTSLAERWVTDLEAACGP